MAGLSVNKLVLAFGDAVQELKLWLPWRVMLGVGAGSDS